MSLNKLIHIFDNINRNKEKSETVLKENQQQVVNFPEKIRRSILRYTESVDINRLLRHRNVLSKDEKDYLKNLDLAFSLISPFKKNIIVFRGINSNNFFVKNNSERLFLKDKGFVSTATDLIIPSVFTGDECCLLVIVIPKGSRVLRINNFIASTDEREVLLPRNGKFIEIKNPLLKTVFTDEFNVPKKVIYLYYKQSEPKIKVKYVLKKSFEIKGKINYNIEKLNYYLQKYKYCRKCLKYLFRIYVDDYLTPSRFELTDFDVKANILKTMLEFDAKLALTLPKLKEFLDNFDSLSQQEIISKSMDYFEEQRKLTKM